MKVRIAVELSDKDMDDILTTAVEGGIGYWSRIENPRGLDFEHLWSNFKPIRLAECDDYGSVEHTLTREKIEKGLKLLGEKYPKRLAELTRGEYDVEAPDMLFQLALFGEVRYG